MASAPPQGYSDPVLQMLTRPLPSLYEGWQDEAGIDLTLWTPTNPGAGAAWARGAFGESLMASASPNALNNARLRSNQRWIASPDNYGANKVISRFILEFEADFTGFANFDNANFFLGLTGAIGDTRSTALANLNGFSLVGAGNALQTLSAVGGAETTFTGFGENLLLANKFRIELFLFAAPGVGHGKFYLNDVLIATHVVNNPSNTPMYLNFYAPAGAGGAATVRLGITRCWYEDR